MKNKHYRVFTDRISNILIISDSRTDKMISYRLVSLGRISMLGIILRNKMKACLWKWNLHLLKADFSVKRPLHNTVPKRCLLQRGQAVDKLRPSQRKDEAFSSRVAKFLVTKATY